jgi:hypothetical protein
MHPFTNVVTCFPDVALDFHRNLQDTSHIGQQTVAYRHSLAKLPFNCNEAAKIFDNLQIAGNGIKKISSQPNGVFSAVSSVTAAGVLLFGLFKCCKSRKNNPVIKTEAPILNKHNKYSNHKKR